MISYFRSILPSRLFLLVLLFLAIRLPLVFLGIPATASELFSMLVGERMADGFAMYRDIYDSTAPLSAFVYWTIDVIAGRSYLTYRLTATFLLLFQAIMLNVTLNRHQVYAGKGYIPALLYLLMGSLTFEFDMLTPLLIGNTFVILSLPYIITISREGFENNRLFVGGFMVGLAALSYLPLTLFLVVAAFGVVLFASNTFRSFLLMLCGFAFPYAVLITYYLYTNTTSFFLEMHLAQPWQFGINTLLPPAHLALVMALPGLILLLSLISTTSLPLRLVFQGKFQQLMTVWLLVSVVFLITRSELSVASFLIILPPIAYFGEFLFTSRTKKWILNLMFFVLLGGVILLRYREPLGLERFVRIDDSSLLLPQQKPASKFSGSTVLVLGDDLSYYEHNKLATPYLNWQLSQRHFGRLNEYQAVYELYLNFRNEAPAYIVDQAGLMPELKHKLPSVFEGYAPTQTAAVYKKSR
ncbi:hypothetical protein H9Q13_09430 [Pontibacter sp. JH31]|uniref:Glycosyltransferase RgtA/B/C/D-like domain-containing protein n=1 Tax=Pontibacter aquaedesilientis TaxID=2766980 RepID=A0ABR7XGH8_9BACT|nr:hypothetical protein [Pontibacter aquaedesilientis]MBD1397385.1 hypothetical protein [Pontibacter aquaedesilientis]